MKSLLFMSLLTFFATKALACPGSAGIEIDTELSLVKGNKIEGYITIQDKQNPEAELKYFNLKLLKEGTNISIPRTQNSTLIFSIVFSEQLNRIVYEVTYFIIEDGKNVLKTDVIDPGVIARGGCGYEVKL